MAYLIGQIWLLLAAATVIGAVLGWLVSEAMKDGRRPAEQRELQARLDAADADADEASTREAGLAAEVRRLSDDKTGLENQLSMLGARLRAARAQASLEPDDDTAELFDDVEAGPAAEGRSAGAPPAG